MAACIALPIGTLPTLPSPLSLTAPALPSVPGLPDLCCKLPPLPVSLPPIPIPPLILNSAVITTLNATIALVQAFLVSLPLKCPLE